MKKRDPNQKRGRALGDQRDGPPALIASLPKTASRGLLFVLAFSVPLLILFLIKETKQSTALDHGSTSTIRAAGVAVENKIASNTVSPQSLRELMELEPSLLERADLAHLNLLCAEGLPGSEQLDVAVALAVIDEWTAHVRSETARAMHLFQERPSDFNNSEAYFRMLTLVTVLQQDFNVHYDQNRVKEIDFTHSDDLFIHGMLTDTRQSNAFGRGGTCVSMPVLYAAIARRLGYPVQLVHTKAHLFCRWDGLNHSTPAYRDRFNVEATNQGMNTFDDSYYKTWPYALSDQEIKEGQHLQSLSAAEEVAQFLAARGHCLFDHGNYTDAVEAYKAAARLAPLDGVLRRYLVAAKSKGSSSLRLVDLPQ